MNEKFNEQEIVEKFQTPEDEINYLRAQIRQKENYLESLGTFQKREHSARDAVDAYKIKAVQEVIHEAHPYHSQEGGVRLPLLPERDDEKVAELLGIMMDRGVKTVFAVLEEINSPHLDDDFHRFLVQYLVAGLDMEDLKKDKEIFKSINMALFEVILPEIDDEKGFKEIAARMEQLYGGMLAISDGKKNEGQNYFTFEIGLANGGTEVIFYASVPRAFSDFFEKQVLSLYPKARLIEQKNDYNIFNENGASVGLFAKTEKTSAVPIKMYSEFEQDPISTILNSFSRIKKDGEGVAIQYMLMPRGDKYKEEYSKVLDNLKKGKSLKELTSDDISFGYVGKTALSFFTGEVNKDETKKTSFSDENAMTLVAKKLESSIIDTNIRIIVSAESAERANMLAQELVGSFKQFDLANGNSLVFEEYKGRDRAKIFHSFSYRLFDPKESLPLSLGELSGLYHFPGGQSDFAELKQSQNQTAPAPTDMPQVGTLLGINKHRHLETPVYIGSEDRVRHFYTIGQTGTGKTTLLKNMIVQDIKDGHGCCFIDPHGSDIQDILANIPPERIDDVIYFDPSNLERPMGLNMLEFDPRFPEQKSNVVDELFGIFNKLFDMKTSGGPAFEQYFRNAAFTVMSHPESGNTLMEIGRVMSDKKYRDMKLTYCTNPLIIQFWQNAEKTTGEAGLSNFVPYITNKFDVFLSNDYMRPIVTQEKSAFNFRDIMDGKKIFLANLAKGKLGDINSSLLGLIIVGKITMAALSRVDADPSKRPDFYLYIDEFQNFTTPSITTILSEARKYRLSLNIAHQYIGQLPEDIKGAIFGNVGSMAVFRVGVEDAEFLQKYFNPPFTSNDIFKLENRNAYIKMLSNGNPIKPFNIVTVAPSKGDQVLAAGLKDLSALKYGTPREEVQRLMMQKYQL